MLGHICILYVYVNVYSEQNGCMLVSYGMLACLKVFFYSLILFSQVAPSDKWLISKYRVCKSLFRGSTSISC